MKGLDTVTDPRTFRVILSPSLLAGVGLEADDAWFGYFYISSNPQLPGLSVRFWLSSFF